MRIGSDVGYSSAVRYKIEQRLGEGAFGVVYRARSNQSGAMVAVKSITEDDDKVNVLRELALMLHFKDCPHIPQIFGALPNPSGSENSVVLMMELLDIDLQQWLESRAQQIEMSHVRLLLYQMLGALHWLHGCGVIHRDIKLPNMLLYKEWFLKVCDLGEADINGEEKKYARVGTYAPRAPELLVNICPYSTATDVWSVGIVFQHLLAALYNKEVVIDEDSWSTSHDSVMEDVVKVTGIPSDKMYEEGILLADAECPQFLDEGDWADIQTFAELMRSMKYKNTSPLDWSKEWEVQVLPQAQDLLGRMLCFDPANRITVSDALQHEFFTKAETKDRARRTFIDEVSSMGVAVNLNRVDSPFIFDNSDAETRLQQLVTHLRKESEHEAAEGNSKVDEYYMHRKRIIGNMMISPLVVPEEVNRARSTLFQRSRDKLLMKRDQKTVLPRSMTIGGLCNFDNLDASEEYMTRSNSMHGIAVFPSPDVKRH